ncbi:TPA: hypothetical protein ACP5VM_003935 [Vibrio parahaemolyticus]|uniref:hypothetical protein n=1 Tax=Vibrio parahaemolyticus TaxID=670 RepID=UPI000463BAE4|nr:hypothetical protein [Vibrio parahaemolyticus]
MLTIRHRYHYGNADINKDGVINGKAITKNEIPALRKNGEYIYRPYKGSLDNVYLLHVQKVKLVNIVAFTHDELGIFDWFHLPTDHYLVGVYRDGGYYVLTKNGQPISHPL